MTPINEPMLQFFEFEHLPPHLKVVSQPFSVLAFELVGNLPRNPERSAALRKLLCNSVQGGLTNAHQGHFGGGIDKGRAS